MRVAFAAFCANTEIYKPRPFPQRERWRFRVCSWQDSTCARRLAYSPMVLGHINRTWKIALPSH